MTRFTCAPARSPKPAVWAALLLVVAAGVLIAMYVMPSAPPSPQEQLVLKTVQLLKEGTETMRQITERGSATLHREAFQANVGQILEAIDQLAKSAAPTDAAAVKALTRHLIDVELWSERYGGEFQRLYGLPDFMAIMQETLAGSKDAVERALQQQRDRPGLLALFPSASPIRIPGR